jgi:hydroxylamine reductase
MEMFCFQCEQTVGGLSCRETSNCGKTVETSDAQDQITYELMKLAVAAEGTGRETELAELFMQALFTTVTNVSFDAAGCTALAAEIDAKREKITGGADTVLEAISGPTAIFTVGGAEPSCRALLVLGLRGMAAYAYHAHVLGFRDAAVDAWLIAGMAAASRSHEVGTWLELLHDFGLVNFACLELLDRANTVSYGHPVPTTVTMEVQPGPFIVVTGHDLHDLAMLAEQCEVAGVAIYTHGEMLPGHAYPELAKYSCLKGHFGTAWQNQRKEFAGVPGAFLFTTNCLMPPLPAYADNIFTTAMVSHPGLAHVPAANDGSKDFSAVIAKAKQLAGWSEVRSFTGINGGAELTTGFGHQSVLSVADVVIDAIKSGELKHLYLVGGCDGALHGRNYFTDLVKGTAEDSIVLTLACGKFRFNDLDLGSVAGLPRMLDLGQCNDAYSAVKVAAALADAFGVGINELPLSLVLSWYEQKAVCVLLSLLALGVKDIYLGPSLPAFVSPEVLEVLVAEFGLRPTTTVAADLAAMRPVLA